MTDAIDTCWLININGASSNVSDIQLKIRANNPLATMAYFGLWDQLERFHREKTVDVKIEDWAYVALIAVDRNKKGVLKLVFEDMKLDIFAFRECKLSFVGKQGSELVAVDWSMCGRNVTEFILKKLLGRIYCHREAIDQCQSEERWLQGLKHFPDEVNTCGEALHYLKLTLSNATSMPRQAPEIKIGGQPLEEEILFILSLKREDGKLRHEPGFSDNPATLNDRIEIFKKVVQIFAEAGVTGLSEYTEV